MWLFAVYFTVEQILPEPGGIYRVKASLVDFSQVSGSVLELCQCRVSVYYFEVGVTSLCQSRALVLGGPDSCGGQLFCTAL